MSYNRAMRWILRSKIHKATVTEANVNYVGSITIDEELMERVGLWDGEKVFVASNTSGARIETYAIPGKRGSGTICMNGAAALLVKKGEEIIIMSFELVDKQIKPKIILVDKKNKFIKYL
jgi:aspartate 1-decarboxylase